MEIESSQGLLRDDRANGQVRCFPSKFPVAWQALKLLVSAGTVLFFSIVLSATVASAPGRSSAVMVAGGSLTVFILIVARMVQNEAKRDYEKAVREGRWQEGVFVFQTGDVVVRFNRPLVNVEQEFPAGSVSLVQGHDLNNIVYILWSDALGHKLTFNVDCSRMVDRPSFIAAEMNRLLNLGIAADQEYQGSTSECSKPNKHFRLSLQGSAYSDHYDYVST